MGLSKTARACLLAGAFTAGVTAAAGPGFAVAAVDKIQDVFITNDENSPVPVRATGTTKVDATGQTLTIVGSADVSGSKVDASGVPITITGDRAAPVPVTVTNQPAGEEVTPYQRRFRITAIPDFHFGQVRFTDVPADERLTITNFGGLAALPLRAVNLAEFCDADAPNGLGGETLAELGPAAPGALQAVNQQTTFVLDPGTCGFATVAWTQDPGQDAFALTITGYTTKVAAAGATARGSGDAVDDAEVDAAARRHAERLAR